MCEDKVRGIVGGELRKTDIIPSGNGICVDEGRSTQFGGVVTQAPAISIIYTSPGVL